MILRRMEKRDVPQVAAIERSTFSQPWSENAFLESLTNNYAYFLVAHQLRIFSASFKASLFKHPKNTDIL